MSSGSQKKFSDYKKNEGKNENEKLNLSMAEKPPSTPPMSLQNATMPPLEKYAHAIAHAMHGNRGKCEK